MIIDRPTTREAGDRLVVAQAQRQVQTFFDELKNGTLNYRTIASLNEQIAQAYRGRCVLELLQNAHDALANPPPDDPRQISFLLSTRPEPVLLIANSGHPFRAKDFEGLCQLGQSPKDPNESVGNKGLGFRSVLEVSAFPEIWSTAPHGSDTSFVFRFDPSVSDHVAAAAREIRDKGLAARSPFDPERPLLDWSERQLAQFLEGTFDAGTDGAREATQFLSPYSIPLLIDGERSEVETLLNTGHVTVVRFALDGGSANTSDEAIQTIVDQLQGLDARSMAFLPDLETLVIDVDGERRILERVVDSHAAFSHRPRTRQQRLLVGQSGPAPDDHTTRQFQVWTRTIGGDDDPDQADRIRTFVAHLPNRWPEVNRVTVSVAVEEAGVPDKGLFVIFLPTDMPTGTGAHINAPFYGSLDRRQIDLSDSYNEFLLATVLDLILDTVSYLVSSEPDGWQARAVIDLLASTTRVGGQDNFLIDALDQRATERGEPLHDLALIHCDHGWCISRQAKSMPQIPSDAAIRSDQWRNHAAFAIVSTALDGRQPAVEALVEKLGGSLIPTSAEWLQTAEQLAKLVQNGMIDVTWDGFLSSLVAVLPADMQTEPKPGAPDPLATAKFLPDQNDRLISASDPAKLFFQPVRGVDDAAELVGEVPDSLKQHVAFLHPDVQTSVQTEHGPQRRNTPVQKFLEGRFAREFRRAELLRDVVLAALPPLPIPHGDEHADLCSELFIWTLKLLGEEPPDALLLLLRRLPVPCYGGWRPMADAVFGPGWPNRLGNEVWSLANDLPAEAASRLRETALLPPNDSRWGIDASDLDGLFARVGVFDGLRLNIAPAVHFGMSEYSYALPPHAPAGIPQQAWDDWREAAREEAKPSFSSWFQYELSRIRLLPEIHHLETLSPAGRTALSHLLLASLDAWPAGWESATVRKLHGYRWSRAITSPLKCWLANLDWFGDGDVFQPLKNRWLVPVSIIGNQPERFRHLNPLTTRLARRLEDHPKLTSALGSLGLNAYPVEQDRTGPGLLQALATAWTEGRIPPGRFDVFLGQLRDAWRHLDPDHGLPEAFLVRTGRRSFSVRSPDQLADVYLPDNRDRTQSLLQHGKLVLEMQAIDATRKADALSAATGIKRASALEERFLVNDSRWTGVDDESEPLDETTLSWFPVILLTVAAHGGADPTGTATRRWIDAANRLRRAHVVACETIAVQLVDGDDIVADSEPAAQWLPGDVLGIRSDMGLSYERLVPAAQDILDRQDLLFGLRLVLGSLSGEETPTLQHIETALERADIDAQALADVHNNWAGSISLIVDRVRPVLTLLDISSDGLDSAATDIERLTEWLSSNLLQWPVPELLSAARQSRDDHAMGVAAWCALGEVAQLPAWNAALARLGDRFDVVNNNAVARQTAEHMEAATPLLRALARHIALETDNPDLFHELESAARNVEARADWSNRWWEVPFAAVLGALRDAYADVPCAEQHLQIIAHATTHEELQDQFHERGIAVEPDPYEIARRNRDALNETLADSHDFHRLWMELNDNAAAPPAPPIPPAELDSRAYLLSWSPAELLDRSLHIIADSRFTAACGGYNSLDEIRDSLGLDRKAVEARRRWRREQQREAERQRRTFDVAGIPFEFGTASFGELFHRLNALPDPVGPRASRDMFTVLTSPPRTGGPGGTAVKGGKTSHLRPSPELRELVGIVGEMHAYRFLRHEFGSAAITPDAWISEIRSQVLPLVAGEPDNTSDSYGYDFRFTHRRTRLHIEVKATAGDETQFDLGISEIGAATRLARGRGGRWRILRVRQALSSSPEFDWLPNPFQEGFKQHFRLHKGGMRVSYRRKRA